MRIFISGTTYLPAMNGQAIFTANLAKGLAQRGHDVLVAYPSEKGTAYSSRENGIRLEGVSSVSLRRWHEDAHFTPFPSKQVHQLIKTFQPEIIHIQDHYLLSRSAVLAARQYNIKSIGTNHFMPENLAPYVPWFARAKSIFNWVGWKWMLDVYNLVDVATAQSKASAGLVKGYGLHVPVFPVSCGIDLGRFHPHPNIDRLACRAKFGIAPNRNVFFFVGRVDKEKRLDVLIHAVHQLNRDDLQLVIAGKGAALKELQSLAKELNLGPRVHFTGFISDEDLPSLLNCVDIFTMPSEAELLSIASLEAMACARPVLLANAVALPELVTNGVNGYLFEPGNIEDAARCMSLLTDHPERWEEMGQASLKHASEYGLDSVLEKYEKIYQALLSRVPADKIQLQLAHQSIRPPRTEQIKRQ